MCTRVTKATINAVMHSDMNEFGFKIQVALGLLNYIRPWGV